MEALVNEIQVAYAFDGASHAALGMALRLASKLEAGVRVVATIEEGLDRKALSQLRSRVEDARSELDSLEREAIVLEKVEEVVANEVSRDVERLRVRDVPISYSTGERSFWDFVEETAKDYEPGLIVVGRPADGSARALEAWAESTRWPTLFVTEDDKRGPTVVTSAVDLEQDISDRVVGWGSQLANALGLRFDVVHVVDDRSLDTNASAGETSEIERATTRAYGELQALVGGHELRVTPVLRVETGTPIERLLEIARSSEDSLLVIGAPGSSLIGDTGETADSILAEHPSAVLCVPSDEAAIERGTGVGPVGAEHTRIMI